jgi:hypothetical protein
LYSVFLAGVVLGGGGIFVMLSGPTIWFEVASFSPAFPFSLQLLASIDGAE